MSSKFPVYQIIPEFEPGELTPLAEAGYLTKFWIEHPTLGNSLVKIDEEEAAQAWTEKVPYELSQLLSLPAASYEFGELQGYEEFADGTQVVVSPNFKQPGLDYNTGQSLLLKDIPNYDYTIEEIFQVLEQNDIGLPENYSFPQGIKDGADLFVGYLLLDTLVANNDRHGGNWSYSESIEGKKALTPIYDNGSSFGVSFGTMIWLNYTPEQYMNTDLSRFGDYHLEVFRRAANRRPLAARIWLNQLAQIKIEEINQIFERIPEGRISEEGRLFAQNLLEYNRTQLLNLSRQLNPSLSVEQKRQIFRQEYERLREIVDSDPNFANKETGDKDLAVAMLILRAEAENPTGESLITRVGKVLSQSDQIREWKSTMPENEFRSKVKEYIMTKYKQASYLRENIRAERQKDRDIEFER